jgi:hypothetical protein
MSNTSKLALVAAVVVAGLSSPAFAAYPGDFANVLPYTASSAPYPVARTHAAIRNGREAFAFAPAQASLTGGASSGYNQAEQESILNR